MQIVADTHTHTISSGHAHSTMMENAAEAARKGHRFLCLTDHTKGIPGAPQDLYFSALPKVLPEAYGGVYLVRGCEVNVKSAQGDLDLPDRLLDRLDWVIASMHTPAYPSEDRAAHTRAWLNVAANPLVDVMGHLGDERYDFDHQAVIAACARYKKIVEINAHSFKCRPGSPENCRDIARLCARMGVNVVVSSDAHFAGNVGEVQASLAMLREIGFPQDMILNADARRFAAVLGEKTGKHYEL